MTNNIVRNSQFINNVPFGLSTPDYRVVDASGNWWNSPAGPRVAGSVHQQVGGDMVSDGIHYQPYLTQPP